jgi:hypothetical protein
MHPTLLENGRIPIQDSWRARLFGLLMIAFGLAGWWYNWHLASTEGLFYVKLCIFGPLGLFGGLLMLGRPEWAGPLRSDSSSTHKTALLSVIGLMIVASGIDMSLLKRGQTLPRSLAILNSSPASTFLTFLGRKYRLASFNKKTNAMWEFVTADQTVDNWTTLLTVVDRPDARTREELDRLAEGLIATYKSKGGRILMAKTMLDSSGAPYNYLVAGFDEPGQRRFELDFVRIWLVPKNAAIVVYGVRVGDPRDYQTKAKAFLNQHSSKIGSALASMVLPDIGTLPRGE